MSRAQHTVCEIIPCVDEVTQPLSFCPSDHPASHSPSLFVTLSQRRYSLREDAAETLIPFPPEYPFPCLVSASFFCHSLSRAWEQLVWGSLHAFSYLNPGFLPSLPWCYFPWGSTSLMLEPLRSVSFNHEICRTSWVLRYHVSQSSWWLVLRGCLHGLPRSHFCKIHLNSY